MGAQAVKRGAVLVAAAALAATVVTSVDTSRDAHRQSQRLDHDIASARAETTEVERTLASIRSSISRSEGRAADDHAEAKRIDAAVVRIQQLRERLVDAAARLRAAAATESQQGGDLRQLQSCWSALDSATEHLTARPADTSGAVDALRAGDPACTAALDLSRGATGAVHTYDFADPSVLVVGERYYAFGTNGPAGTIQVLSSTDLEHWEIRPDALRSLPAWAQSGQTWAPAVHRIGESYVMYYAVHARSSGKHCISVATSAAPAGPYVDDSTGPLVCQTRLGGSIDPDVYTDGFGFAHLIWKSDGSSADQPAQIWSQYLGGDGTTLLGQPVLMLSADQAWQDHVVENPSMVWTGGSWYLVYSGNRWNTDRYVTAYAVCASENGPCATPRDPILLSGTATTTGTGGAQVFRRRDGTAMVAWAAWDRGYVGLPNIRRLHIGTFRLDHGRPTITER